jgi:hypothetical protein
MDGSTCTWSEPNMNSASTSGPENPYSLLTVPPFMGATWREMPLFRLPIGKGGSKVSCKVISL